MFRRPEDYILAVYTTQVWSTSSRILSLELLRPVVTSYTTQPTQNTITSLMCFFTSGIHQWKHDIIPLVSQKRKETRANIAKK